MSQPRDGTFDGMTFLSDAVMRQDCWGSMEAVKYGRVALSCNNAPIKICNQKAGLNREGIRGAVVRLSLLSALDVVSPLVAQLIRDYCCQGSTTADTLDKPMQVCNDARKQLRHRGIGHHKLFPAYAVRMFTKAGE